MITKIIASDYNRHQVILLTAVSLIYPAACSDNQVPDPIDTSAAVDAAVTDVPVPDASTPVPIMLSCSGPYGPSSIVDEYKFDEVEAAGFDLDGDGDPDNALFLAAEEITSLFDADIKSGEFRLLLELHMPPGCDLVNCPSLTMAGYNCVDSDVPPNITDDFSGGEAYYFERTDVNPTDCSPVTILPGQIVDGQFTGETDILHIPLASLVTFPLLHARFEATIAPVGTNFAITSSRLGGILTPCLLNETPSPLGQTLLWTIVELFELQPDIDLDGDGIERINTGLFGVQNCTDGDGEAVDEDMCGCDPRIVDGFSVNILLTSVGAKLLGPAPSTL